MILSRKGIARYGAVSRTGPLSPSLRLGTPPGLGSFWKFFLRSFLESPSESPSRTGVWSGHESGIHQKLRRKTKGLGGDCAIWGWSGMLLVAPYRAIPRDYLSDTPLLRAMGFLVSQHGQLGAIPSSHFLSVSPLESMRSGGAIPTPQEGYLSDTCAIAYEKGKRVRYPPLRYYLERVLRDMGGVSRTGPLRECSTLLPLNYPVFWGWHLS